MVENDSELKKISSIGQNSSSQKSNITINSTFRRTIKKIGEHIISDKDKNINKKKYTAEFITEIKNIFVSGGTNNELIIYNDSYGKIFSNQTDDWIYNVLENENKISKALSYLACSKKKIYVYSEFNKTNVIQIENNLLYLFFMECNYYFACCEKDIFLFSALADQLQNKSKFSIYENILMKSAIKINNDLLVFKSNKIASKGISQLILYILD